MENGYIKLVVRVSLDSIGSIVNFWCAGGKREGNEYIALNPNRSDSSYGSFKVNLTTGAWADFAIDKRGGDLVSLVAYLDGVSQLEAAKRVAKFLGKPYEQGATYKPATSVRNKAINAKLPSKKETEWLALVPVPSDAPPPPTKHFKNGKPSMQWCYQTPNGIACYIYRFDSDGSRKQFAPLTYCEHLSTKKKEWRWQGLAEPRPLYNLDKIINNERAIVIVCEGEKSADAAALLMPAAVTTTMLNGAQSPAKTDWNSLCKRIVWLWPDNDTAGVECMSKVRILLDKVHAKQVKIINPQAFFKKDQQVPDKWDAADALSDGFTAESFALMINKANFFIDEPVESREQETHSRSSSADWGPMELPGTIQAPKIAPSILPSWAGDMAAAVALDTQTDPSASVLLALPMIAACVQRRYVVAPYGDDSYTEPLSLWTLSALPSGSRKTPILKALSDPLRKWEKLLSDKMRTQISSNEATIRVAKKRIETLEAKAAKQDNYNERERFRVEIKEEMDALPAALKAPRLITGDVTPERLQEMLVEYGERMSLLSDEAGIFNVLGGMYSGGVANLDVFLQAYSGSSVRVDRKARSAHLENPALTIGLALQPDVLNDVANDKRFHDSGLLARFLFCIPHSTVGTRNVRQRNPIPPSVSMAWREGLHDLLEGAAEPIDEANLLPFTAEAQDEWLDFAQKVENELGVGKKLANMTEWGAKLPGQCARIAGLIQLVTTGKETNCIKAESVKRAVELTNLLVSHAKAAYRLLGADHVESDAIALIKWIKANELESFERARAQKALEGRFRTVDKLKTTAERLEEWNVLSKVQHRKNKGARSTPYYNVNPRLLDTSSKSL